MPAQSRRTVSSRSTCARYFNVQFLFFSDHALLQGRAKTRFSDCLARTRLREEACGVPGRSLLARAFLSMGTTGRNVR
jgi:hypothetical protein